MATTGTHPLAKTTNGGNIGPIIVYSIVGGIAAVFLAIIIAGFLRVRRYPERYGPRYAIGRLRQSRAKGIARAMLETIPIVVGGDGDGGITLNHEGQEIVRRTTNASGELTCTSTRGPASASNTEISKEEQSSSVPRERNPAPVPDEDNSSCPICTDDFVKGQGLRLLPCNHAFHSDCVDPWLVNVSGTCPVCRIDLHQENGEQEMKRANDEERLQEGEAEPMSDEHRNRQHRGLAAYLQGILDAQRLLGATVEERLTALRSIRERNRHQHGGSPEDAEERQGQLQCTVSTATPRWESFNRDAIAREA